MKMFFLKMKLFFHELFVYRIPEFWERTKEAFRDDLWKTIGLIVLVIASILAIFEGYEYSKVTRAQEAQKAMNKKIDKGNHLMNIYSEGPEKYLEEQLGVNNKAQVIKMFNNSAKWQGRYDEVITRCTKFTKNSQFRSYLNPIVNDILNGPLVSQEKANFSFAKNFVDPNGDDATNGVMMILISSKDQKQVDQVEKLINAHPNYKVVVFDEKSPNGKNNFNNCMLSYLESSSGIRSGYNQDNSWTGIAYAFNDNKPVFHSKTLDNLPKNLPDKSLSGKDDME